MPVKIRITLLFASLVLGKLILVCGSVYYFSFTNRIRDIQNRLFNRAVTTGRLLSQGGGFDQKLIKKIDASTTITMRDKVEEAYDSLNRRIYSYSDSPADSIGIDTRLIDLARQKGEGAVGDLNDQDINIKVDKVVVYIDISDKLLFNSGEYNVTPRAEEVLGKVAKVLKNQPDIEFMVEGHTDNKPYRGRGVLLDNWDLSVKRATSVVRILQNKYGLEPTKIAAAGRGEYLPVATNDTPEGRALNRRTRIIILPQLDQFFKLLEKK